MAYETQSEKRKKSYKEHAQAFIDTITGYGGQKQAEQAGELAERQQDWNEEYSEKQFDEQKRQFEKSQEMAQANLDYQKEYSEKNYQAQQEAFLYQKQENDLMREREDTSFQRQVKDLTAAGLSPLAVSGGASAQSGNVVSAPQYDTSGVSSAQGNLLALQQQYAELMNVAQGNYANRRQQAVNQRIAAKQVLAEQYERNRTYGMQFSSQLFNQALALKDFDLRERQADQQIAYSKAQMNWNEKHGWRNEQFWQMLMPAIKDIASDVGLSTKTISDAITGGIDKLQEVINSGKEGAKENKPDYQQQRIDKLSDSDFNQLIMWSKLPKSLQPKKVSSLANIIYKCLDDKQKLNLKSVDDVEKFIKKEGIQAVLGMVFGF